MGLRAAALWTALAFPVMAQQAPDCAADFARAKQVFWQLEGLGTPVVTGTRCSFAAGTGPWRAPMEPLTWRFEGAVLDADLDFRIGPDADLPMRVSISLNMAAPDSASIFFSVADKTAPSQGIFGTLAMDLEGLQSSPLLALQETKQTALVRSVNAGMTINSQSVSPTFRALQNGGQPGSMVELVELLAANLGGQLLTPGADEALLQFVQALPDGEGTLNLKLTSDLGIPLYPVFAALIFGEVQSEGVMDFLPGLRLSAAWYPDKRP